MTLKIVSQVNQYKHKNSTGDKLIAGEKNE